MYCRPTTEVLPRGTERPSVALDTAFSVWARNGSLAAVRVTRRFSTPLPAPQEQLGGSISGPETQFPVRCAEILNAVLDEQRRSCAPSYDPQICEIGHICLRP